MQHISTTPFGPRAVTHGLLAARALALAPLPDATPDKWALLKDLTAARTSFGITDRDLAVLSALVSFHPQAELGGTAPTIVFPSNAALSERAHGMAESTLRRHLSALVRAGLILRHDSPNGKRYAARRGDGSLSVAYGFDLRPLVLRAEEIAEAAETARALALRQRRLREAVVLRLRDATKLIAYAQQQHPGALDALDDAARLLARALRRKLDTTLLEQLNAEASALLEAVNQALFPHERVEMSGSDNQNERHFQCSNRIPSDSESAWESAPETEDSPPAPPEGSAVPKLPLSLVVKSCPDLLDYVPRGIGHWHELVAAADFVRPMLGITADAWGAARRAMGDSGAAIALACILQRASAIRSPGGYLRSLTQKAVMGQFSPAPMVMALLRAENRQAI